MLPSVIQAGGIEIDAHASLGFAWLPGLQKCPTPHNTGWQSFDESHHRGLLVNTRPLPRTCPHPAIAPSITQLDLLREERQDALREAKDPENGGGRSQETTHGT